MRALRLCEQNDARRRVHHRGNDESGFHHAELFPLMRAGAAALLAALALDAAAAEPGPSVPALMLGSSPPLSFMVNGVLRLSKSNALAFRVATDGKDELCILYDAADGTPIFISNGRESLVYDLLNTRVVRLPRSRGGAQVEWHGEKEAPLSFGFGFFIQELESAKQGDSNAWFRIDQFVAASGAALKRRQSPKGIELFAAERPGAVESLQMKSRDASWYRFTSRRKDEDFDKLELEATQIGRPIPAASLAFPDYKRLRQDIAVTELDSQSLLGFVAMLRDGRVWLAKLVLTAGGEADQLKLAFPSANWEELRRRDAELGPRYRAALARQGLQLPVYKATELARPER